VNHPELIPEALARAEKLAEEKYPMPGSIYLITNIERSGFIQGYRAAWAEHAGKIAELERKVHDLRELLEKS